MAHTSNDFGFVELPDTQHHAPAYGLLTRTLVHSPVVKQIIPARIRGREYNDVVFVGETFIELYLLGDNGRLRKVGAKTDFQADIRHARVCAFNANPSGIHLDDTMSEDTKSLLPPHILILSMDSGHIAFLYAVQKGSDVQFVMSTRKIDGKGPHPRHLGKSLAVDPRSQALAVTAYQDTFRLFALYEAEELERQLQAGMPLNPIKEERTFHVNGVILHMEFLYPAPKELDHVILILLIVDPKQKFRLMLYEWSASNPLQTATKYGQHGLRLSDEVTLPLHIIPLLIDTAFLIITEFSIYAVRQTEIKAGQACLSKHEFPRLHLDGGRQSLVTSWARPLRTPTHTQTMDDLYLAMEDGDIYFIEVGLDGPNLVQLVNKAGRLDCAIGSAFAALDYGLRRNDLLVAGGEMSSGGVYLLKIGPSKPVPSYRELDEEPKLEETVPNWSPVFDFDLINPAGRGHVQGRAVRDRMYACTGRGKHGAIAEIRCGIQGSIQSSADYLPGIRNIWVFPDLTGNGVFLLCALPDRSTLCFLNHMGEWEDVSECELLDMNRTTLAAAAIGHRSIQITTNAININQLCEEYFNTKGSTNGDVDMIGDNTAKKHLMWSKDCGPDSVIVAAAIFGIYMVVAVRSGQSVKMTLIALLSEVGEGGNLLNERGQPVDLKEDPSFVSIFQLGEQLLAAVGTRAATVLFYLIDPDGGLLPLLEQSMVKESELGNDSVQRDLYICESACLIKSSTATYLLCGLRDGTLTIFNIVSSSRSPQLSRIDDIQFGPIPVQLLSNERQQDSVLVLAGPELYRFQLVGSELQASQIVFEGSTTEPALVAVAYIDNSSNLESFVLCATQDQIFYAEVGNTEKVCVRRLPVMETPRRLLYSKSLNLLIVASSKSDTQEVAEKAVSGVRKKGTMSSLSFLDPQSGESKADSQLRCTSSGNLIFGKANEQIYGLAEWNVQVEGRKYQYIAVSTGFINTAPQQAAKGRVIVLSANLVNGRIEVKRRFQLSCEGPVYSVVPYGSASLVYCTGNKLCFMTLNTEKKKLDTTAEFKLRSPAVQITVNEPYINASCARDSLCIIKFEDGQLRAHYSDEITRNAFSHFSPLPDLYLISDKHYGIAGLWQPPERRNNGSLQTVFDTQITSSISRIRSGRLRPPWTANKPRLGVVLPDRDIIGSGVDGSIYQFIILTEDALRLLRYIQGLYMAYTDTSRHGVTGVDDDIPEDTSVTTDVDGDLLYVVLKMGVDWLREAVKEGDAKGNTRGGPGFKDMVEKVLGSAAAHSGEERDEIARAVQYMKELLSSVVL